MTSTFPRTDEIVFPFRSSVALAFRALIAEVEWKDAGGVTPKDRQAEAIGEAT